MRTLVALLLLGVLCPAIGARSCNAAVVNFRITGTTSARVGPFVRNRSSQSASALLQSLVYDGIGYTYAAQQWQWDGSDLFARSRLITRQIRPWNAPFLHRGSTNLTFEFTVDTQTTFDLNGTWGFQGNTGADSLNVQLSGSSGVLFADSTTSTGGLNSDSFTGTGLLNPGTYTFTIGGTLEETYSGRAFAAGGFNLASFRLRPASIPEPSTPMLTMGLVLYLARFRGRRRARNFA